MNLEIVTQKLKRYWKVDDLLLVAEYRRSDKNPRFGFFSNLSANDRKVKYPPTEGQKYDIHVILHLPHNENLISGQHYAVRVTPSTKNTSNNPYMVELEEVLEIEGYDSPREFIKKWFSRKGENPGDAATIASQLRLNELELYTQTERFIFELLQNADDMPTNGKKVNVSMELVGDYFLFLHDGKFFDRNDVMAIADAARSTKSRDKAKTGYKGIGFKSVFTDSTRVFIKSFDYSFKFDKLHPIYSDFWQLYGKYVAESSEAKQKEIKIEYTGREGEFTQIERIPWQIKPIWVERADFPDALKNSTFLFGHNVSIGLEIGQATLAEKQYHQKISNLLSEPRFLLFLRNITSVAYKHNDHSSTLAMERATESQLNIRLNESIHSTYTKWEAEITISNESFAAAGLHFQKRTLQEGKYEFVTQDGQLIKNIPEKLSILDKTAITFAAQIQSNKIRSIPEEEAILFNYLPTSDKRFEFPFLVNADFVTKTDREFILHENLWNQYLFFHIGYMHIKWLRELALTSSYQSSYLSLLVDGLKDETDQSEGEINTAFNRGLRQAVAKVPFIQTEAGRISASADIILDETKLASVLGSELFYALMGTAKTLPDTRVKASILRRDFLAIEQFNVEHLANLLVKQESVALFAEAISTFDDLQYKAFLTWFNIHCKENGPLFNSLVPTLPFFRFGNKELSWSAMADKEEYLLLDDRTYGLQSELAALGFTVSALNIDHFTTLKSALLATNTYVDKDALLYTKVSARCSQYGLKPTQKATLFTFFTGLTNENKYAKTLYLFADESGVCRPLDKLLSRNVDGLPLWLAAYKITDSEFGVLPPVASEHLVKATNLFSQLLCDPAVLADCTKNLDSQHVSEWVKQLLTWRAKDSVTPVSGWSALPWIYTNDTHRFKAAAELWDHGVLTTVPAQAVIETLTGWIIPHPDSRPLIQQFGLLLKSEKLTTGISHIDTILPDADARLLIRYLKEAGENTFLKKWQFLRTEAGFKLTATTNQTVYASDASIQSFIETTGLNESFISVPDGLADEDTLAAIGAITGDTLLALLSEKKAVFSLASLLLKRADPKLYAIYIHYLPALSLSSISTYTDESPEVHVLRIAHDIVAGGNLTLFSSFLNKTTLDGHPISEIIDFLPVVTVKNLVGKEPFKFSTAELLPNNAGRIQLIQRALNAFSNCKLISQRFLRDQVFSSVELKADNAESEIHKSTPDFLSPVQLVFLQSLRQSKGETNPHFKTKDFYTYWKERKDDKKAWSEVKEYLTLLYDRGLKTSHLTYGLDSYVVDPDYCYEDSESLPDFFANWADTDDKLLFLTELNEGANGSESSVVRLRKALLLTDIAVVEIQARTVNNDLLINTLRWLDNKEDDVLTTATIGGIRLILKKIKWPTDRSPLIPRIISIDEGNKLYRLAEFTNEAVHTWSDDWKPYESQILTLLTKEKIWVVENDFPNDLGQRIGKLNSKDPVKKLATDILRDSDPLSEPCYKESKLEEDYPIYVIHGSSIPWEVWYDNSLVTNFFESNSYFDESTNITYLTAESSKNFPRNLPGNFPETYKNILYELAWKLREHPEADTRSQTKFYTPEFERIIGGDELNDEQQGKEFKSAILRGVPYLEEQGFDFSECTVSTGLHFLNVRRDGFKAPYHITFRSAKRGLLYLNLGAWKRLGVNNDVLIVVYQGGEMRLFSSKEELLAEKWNEYMMYRVEKPAKIDENYEGISLHDKTTHLLFVTNEKMYRSLYQDKIAQKSNEPTTAATSSAEEL